MLFFSRPSRPPYSTLFPYTTLFRSPGQKLVERARRCEIEAGKLAPQVAQVEGRGDGTSGYALVGARQLAHSRKCRHPRSEEHTSELQSRPHLVCRLLLEKKKQHRTQ